MLRTVLTAIAVSAIALGVSAKEITILTIGNSFADSVAGLLPKVAESAGDKVEILRANIGGCSLERHWNEKEKSDADPNYKPYNKKYTLKDRLTEKKLDFVTIQQASHLSWKPESYEPYAKNLQEYVKEYAPGAELVIQQTWAYRFDDGRLRSWKMTQREMYDKLTTAYDKAAKDLGIRLIPTGDAVQLARETQAEQYVPYNPEDLKTLERPALPSNKGSMVTGHYWMKKRGTENEYELKNDPSHLNERGKYLQACVWYGFFFNKPTSEIKFVPKSMTAEDAAFMREVAQTVLDKRYKK